MADSLFEIIELTKGVSTIEQYARVKDFLAQKFQIAMANEAYKPAELAMETLWDEVLGVTKKEVKDGK